MNVICHESLSSRSSVRTVVLVMSIVIIIFGYAQWANQTGERSIGISPSTEQAYQQQSLMVDMIHDVDCSFIDRVMKEVVKTRSKIESNWDVSHFPNFKAMMNIPEQSWNLQKAKFVKLVLEAGSNHGSQLTPRLNANHYNLHYVVGFSGSSVTAGHGEFISNTFCVFLVCCGVI